MKKFLKTIRNDTIASLHNRPGGFSARKLTAFTTMILVIYLHFNYVDVSNVVSVLFYDMLFILLLLSIITIDQLYKLKFGNGKPEEPKEDTSLDPKTNNNTNKSDIG